MDNPIYFLHIPKTGGTSFIHYLDSHFATDEVCPAQLLPELFNLPAEALARYRLYRGHLWYGLDSYLDRRLTRITVLRDPIQRTISWYSHVKRDENAYRHRRVVDERWSLSDFIHDKETNWDVINAQTLFLAVDLDYSQLARDPVGYGQAVVKGYAARLNDRKALDAAKKRLEQFAFVGITERMEESMYLLSYQMGWYPDIPTSRLNVSDNRLSEDEVPCETKREIMAINQLDQELYEWAYQYFEEQFGRMVRSLLVTKHEASKLRLIEPWQMQPLPVEHRRLFDVQIIESPSEVDGSETFTVVTEIVNNSYVAVASAAPNPVHISYHFIDATDGSVSVFDGDRTKIWPRLAANQNRTLTVSVKAPNDVGRYILRVTLVQEGIAWFDEAGSRVFSEVEIAVRQARALRLRGWSLRSWKTG